MEFFSGPSGEFVQHVAEIGEGLDVIGVSSRDGENRTLSLAEQGAGCGLAARYFADPPEHELPSAEVVRRGYGIGWSACWRGLLVFHRVHKTKVF